MPTRICPGHLRLITRTRRASRALEGVKKVLTAGTGRAPGGFVLSRSMLYTLASLDA